MRVAIAGGGVSGLGAGYVLARSGHEAHLFERDAKVGGGQTLWTVAAAAGVVALLTASEPVFRALKLAGAAYLVYLGAQSIHAAVRGRGKPRPL